MESKIVAGTYTAKPNGWCIGTTKKGDPQAIVNFEFNDDAGVHHELTYFGSFKEKARPYTIKALLNCGLKDNDLERFAEGVTAGALDVNQDVQIVVSIETNDAGKSFPKIQWVNKIGMSFKNMIPPGEAKAMLQTLNRKADILAVKTEMGIQGTVSNLKKKDPESELPKGIDEDESIGF